MVMRKVVGFSTVINAVDNYRGGQISSLGVQDKQISGKKVGSATRKRKNTNPVAFSISDLGGGGNPHSTIQQY